LRQRPEQGNLNVASAKEVYLVMTDTLREIEKAHEAKFKLDEELRFKAQCRRDKLLGLWAAEHLGMTQPHADAYAKNLVRLGLDEGGGGNVLDKMMADFEKMGVKLTQTDVTTAAEQFYASALEQLSKDFPKALGRDHERVGD
jgi:hypothetical protein